jgi:hypothetical protein
MEAMTLSFEHLMAVHRKRNIRHFNPFADFESPLIFESSEDIVRAMFDNGYEEGLDFATLCWDFADGGCGSVIYESRLLPPMKITSKEGKRADAKEAIRALIDMTRQIEGEAFWNHRMNGPELNPGSEKYEMINEIKKSRPDWVIKNWWWQGFWNYESPGLRQFKLSLLEEILTTYDLDGLQLDFLRDVPVLPPGRQWSLRDCITEFVYNVRKLTLRISFAPALISISKFTAFCSRISGR